MNSHILSIWSLKCHESHDNYASVFGGEICYGDLGTPTQTMLSGCPKWRAPFSGPAHEHVIQLVATTWIHFSLLIDCCPHCINECEKHSKTRLKNTPKKRSPLRHNIIDWSLPPLVCVSCLCHSLLLNQATNKLTRFSIQY